MIQFLVLTEGTSVRCLRIKLNNVIAYTLVVIMLTVTIDCTNILCCISKEHNNINETMLRVKILN